MRKLLNTLYISSEQLYLSLDNSNVVVKNPDGSLADRIPLHMLESIVTFSRKGLSVPLIGRCSAEGIQIFLMTENGSLVASINMPSRGNVLLRKAQYRLSDQSQDACRLASAFSEGKLQSMKHTIDRFVWAHKSHPASFKLCGCSSLLERKLSHIRCVSDVNSLRGIEGEASAEYFRCFGDMIQNSENGVFLFHGRSRRPPLDCTNALLSFTYTLLTNECAAALESVGLDACAGFLHQDHLGRKSLACDLVEELRSSLADRFVLQMINNRELSSCHFDIQPDGAVCLNREGRRIFLYQWQIYKRKEIMHPVLQEKIPFGLIPYAQAMLLARYIRGDLACYQPYFRR